MRPTFDFIVSWFGVYGCYDPITWLQENPRAPVLRYNNRLFINKVLSSGVSYIKNKNGRKNRIAHGYTNKAPFVVTEMDKNGKVIRVIPIMSFNLTSVLLYNGVRLKIGGDEYLHIVEGENQPMLKEVSLP